MEFQQQTMESMCVTPILNAFKGRTRITKAQAIRSDMSARA